MNNKMSINAYLSTIESKKYKINEEAEQKQLIDTENILTVARWEGCWGGSETGEGIKKYKLGPGWYGSVD